MTKEQFLSLLQGFKQQKLSPEELRLFLEKADDPSFEALLGDQFLQDLAGYAGKQEKESEEEQLVWARLQAQRKLPAGHVVPVHRVHFLRKWWWAAASIVLLIIAAWIWTGHNRKGADGQPVVSNQPALPDIPPARRAAVLTLADGSTITPDSIAKGNLADQGGSRIVKLDNGELTYVSSGMPAGSHGEMLYNTMSTPVGSQYRLTLPDGTHVWLNAASSITYPTVFAGNDRQVSVRGEVYFEVKKDKTKPFIVDVDGKCSIQVLGTSFNVNAYRNERSVNTTLLEGSVQLIRTPETAGKPAADKVLLKPGEQAKVMQAGPIAIVKEVDEEKVMAWKNGLFNFHDAQLEEVMREIARWYDIEVVYEKAPPKVEFVGKISRDLSLQQVLNGLRGTGFNFRIEGKKLLVSP